jgi:winged helix DNA-binding protein
MRRFSSAQRQARLSRRHALVPGDRDIPGLVTDLVALHATDPASVYLSVLSRLSHVDIPMVEAELYDRRSLVRMLGMRRTMFVVTRELAPVVQAACTDKVAATQRRLLVKHLTDLTDVADVPGWLADVEESTYAALCARGSATANQLAEDEPRLRTQLHVAQDKPYAAKQNITSRVLLLLAAQARIVRGRPTGSWNTTTYRWSTMDAWLPGGMPRLDPAEARAELLRHWLAAFGPGRLRDITWWAGWTVREAKQALAAVGAVEVGLDDATGFVLPDDLDEPPETEPAVALLPALDPTPMGWVERDWYLAPHRERLFDRTGNIGPTVWWDGRIVGGWAIRPDGEIAHRLLTDIGAAGERAVTEAAARIAAAIGDTRPTPRFRTPLERELVG